MSETVRNKPEHRHVEFRDIRLFPCLVAISLPDDNNRQVGNALFLHNGDNDQAVLWHIFVDKDYRKRGFATGIIEHAKLRWCEIATDAESEAGHALCIKCGFKSRKTDMLRLFWKREE